MAYKIKSKKLKEKKESYKTTLYAVDYNDGESETFEIFETKEEAEKFAKKMKGHLWVADFNKEFVFMENGLLNYEDVSSLYKNRRNLK